MKKFGLLLIAILAVACNDDKKLVDTNQHLYDSLSKTEVGKIHNDLVSKIQSIPEIKKLLGERVVFANLDNEETQESLIFKALSTYFEPVDSLSFKGKINENNTILVAKRSNISAVSGLPIDSLSHGKLPFDIYSYRKDGGYLNPDRTWSAFQGNNFEYAEDSINKIEKKNAISDYKDYYLKPISGTRYMVFVADRFMFSPKKIGTTAFDTGLLITTMKVFDLQTGKVIGQKTFYVVNSDEVTSMKDDESYGMHFHQMSLQANLESQSYKAINKFLEQ